MDYEKNRRIRKDLIDFLEELSKLGKNTNFDKWSKSDCAEWIAWVEKQGEQKPVPKFKVGDWVIGRATNNEPRQISEITDQHYKSTYGGQYGFSFEDEMHLWTIQDAKDGDVLVYRDGQWCFIYKGIVTEDTFKYYALLSEKGITVNDAAFCLLTSCIIPATNEQRDLLFQKIKEAGYEWNAEKKELNKIEQESEERSEEDKEMKETKGGVSMETFIQVEKPVAYLEHKATKSILPVYTPIGWFKRFMLRFCFGLKYNKEQSYGSKH